MASDQQKKLLIVDDESSIRDLLWGLFHSEKTLKLQFAQDGTEAIDQVNHEKPDMVLLDVMMPGPDGFQVCKHIRKLYRDSVYVIMFTALAGPEPEEKARLAGADLYLNKPFDLRMLHDLVKKKSHSKSKWHLN